MLSVPKQQSHKRELPSVFEGNKQNEQQGPMTTFKNWASEVQIYMVLEDHNMATILDLEDIKTQKHPIVDVNYIDYCLHEQGLSQKDEEEIRKKELTKQLRVHATRAEPTMRRNQEKARRRVDGEDGVPTDEAVPPHPELPDTFKPFTDELHKKIDEFTKAFHHRALQYMLTKVTKGEPYKFVVQCNHNNSSGLETWRRVHITYDLGEKAQHLATLSRIMKPTWNNTTQSSTDFIKTFQNWRDEIFNYEQAVSEIASTMKMTLLIQHMHGDIKSYLLLLHVNLAKTDFDEAATKVEDYYKLRLSTQRRILQLQKEQGERKRRHTERSTTTN
eukprot:5823247-Amphidinium_carterae.1